MASEAAGKAIRRGVLSFVALAVLALVLPPFINVGRYKSKVVESMSNALGRPVTVDSIELRLLPQPGFDLENVAIGDDPAYSAEPILHAEEVTAYLGLSSFWRGRLEIARLKLNYPSLNLVERDDASWNLESLLWKASRTQVAPTSEPLSSSRPRFPYIEATNGRINFKYGLEKSVFSFTDADFTLWSPAENQWSMRLRARPVRTDMPVTDTGTIKAEATLQRAVLLRDAPMKATVTWERVQLGNLTRLIYGEDRGWRGALEASAQFNGTPGALEFTTAAKLRDFRRYDISSGDAANLDATCSGELNVSASRVQGTECRLPLEGGLALCPRYAAWPPFSSLRSCNFSRQPSCRSLAESGAPRQARPAGGPYRQGHHFGFVPRQPLERGSLELGWQCRAERPGSSFRRARQGSGSQQSGCHGQYHRSPPRHGVEASPRNPPSPSVRSSCTALIFRSAPTLPPRSKESSTTSDSLFTSRETPLSNASSNLPGPSVSALRKSRSQALPQSI